VLTKLFRIRIKIRLKLKILIVWTIFKTYNTYLTFDCWCLIKYVLKIRLLGILNCFISLVTIYIYKSTEWCWKMFIYHVTAIN